MRMFVCAVVSILLSYLPVSARSVPGHTGYVNDYASLMSKSDAQKLEERLKEFEKLTSNEIAILTVESLEGENLEDFSIRVADSWKPGKRNKDNGVLLLISKKDKKMRLEVGDGLTGRLTDLLSGRVIDGAITPKFKNGDFYGGIDGGVSMIIKIIQGEYTQDSYNTEEEYKAYGGLCVVLIIVSVIAGAISVVAGGVVGGLCGLTVGGFCAGFPGAIIGAIIGAIVGIVGGIFLRFMLENSGSSGGSGGGYSGGSSDSGGGSSFSFGGGGFSGGGASGSW
jgi:uncharacterized protein